MILSYICLEKDLLKGQAQIKLLGYLDYIIKSCECSQASLLVSIYLEAKSMGDLSGKLGVVETRCKVKKLANIADSRPVALEYISRACLVEKSNMSTRTLKTCR
jgi:hypothetical protein